jgi:hypothetical protein
MRKLWLAFTARFTNVESLAPVDPPVRKPMTKMAPASGTGQS